MPMHDYVCEACGHVFEKYHSVYVEDLHHVSMCPKCGAFQAKVTEVQKPARRNPAYGIQQ